MNKDRENGAGHFSGAVLRSLSRPRLLAVSLLMVIIAAGCTGEGCKGCAGCGSCAGGEDQEQAGVKEDGKADLTAKDMDETMPDESSQALESGTAKAGAGDKSGMEGGVTDKAKEIVAPPISISAERWQASHVKVEWKFGEGAISSFQLERAGAAGDYRVIARPGPFETLHIDGPLDMGQYKYRVKAIGSRGASTYAGPTTVVLESSGSVPVAPSNLSASQATVPSAVLSWRDNSDNEAYFRVERSGRTAALLGPGTTGYIDTTVQAGKSYSYRVYAGNDLGESAPAGPASVSIEKETRPPDAPSRLSRKVTADPKEIVLTWRDNSDNEDGFVLERKVREADKWFDFDTADENATEIRLESLGLGDEATLRVLAKNEAGRSGPSNSITVLVEPNVLGEYVITVYPDGVVSISDPSVRGIPAMRVESIEAVDDGINAEIAVVNRQPEVQLEDVYAAVVATDSFNIRLADCDRGPTDCSVSGGVQISDYAGYQYVEGGHLGGAPAGGELEHYPTRDRTWAVRDICPSCGSRSVTWKFEGVTSPTEMNVRLYGRKAPADFREDYRYNEDRSLWMIETYKVGEQGYYEAGWRDNPSSIPSNYFRPGDIVAVNVSLEAADWMESQGEMSNAQDGGDYVYWWVLSFGLTYDPEVLIPISGPVKLPGGGRLETGFQDAIRPPNSGDDGWITTGNNLRTFPFPEEGFMQFLFTKPMPGIEVDDEGNEVCRFCGLEGFVNEDGTLEGPDPEPEAKLGVLYFRVVGEPGDGSPIRLMPNPDTVIDLYRTRGNVTDMKKQDPIDRWTELNLGLPKTQILPGDYQVNESYICVE